MSKRTLASSKQQAPVCAAEATGGLQQQQQQQQQKAGKRARAAAAANQPEEPVKCSEAHVCAACGRPIREKYLLAALEKHWHEDCLKCACCDCRLGEVGSSLFIHSDKLLCRRDFLRIFGQQGECAACQKPIPPYELVMRAAQSAYHMDCFACAFCQYRFCVGDKFHLIDQQRILCLICYGERQHQHSIQNQDNLQQAPGGAAAAAATEEQQPQVSTAIKIEN